METKEKPSKLKKILIGAGIATTLGLGSLPQSTESFTGRYESATEIRGMGLVSYGFNVDGKTKNVESIPSGLEKGSTYHVTVKEPILPIYSNRTTFEKQ